MESIQGATAIVTGASSGIGEHIARQLAARGVNLVVTARRADRLEALAKELRAAHKVEVDVVPLDLGQPNAPTELYEKTEGAGKHIDILINNAGFGTQEHFVDIPWDKTREQMQLNILSLTELTHRFLKVMLPRKRGWILNVASIGAYIPCPDYATYSAGKAYVRDFTEALAYELRRAPVRVCCLCPGGTATEFLQVAGQKETALVKLALMSPARCARIGLRALFGGRRNIVAGVMNTIGMFWLRFTPRRAMVWIAALVMAKR
jgi:short-subunit dehydrogenase